MIYFVLNVKNEICAKDFKPDNLTLERNVTYAFITSDYCVPKYWETFTHIFTIYQSTSMANAMTHIYQGCLCLCDRAVGQTYIKLKFQKAQTGVTRCEYCT